MIENGADTDWIAETYTSDEGWDHLETLVDMDDRMAGTPGERRAAEATRDALARHARDARLDTFGVARWERVGGSVRAGERDHDCFALPRSPSREVTAPLYDAGYGTPGDFDGAEGCVVVASSDSPPEMDRFLHRREKYYRAAEAGARAFVFRNHIEGCLAPTGSVGGRDGPYGPIPAVGVGYETGARLVRRHEGDEVSVSVEAHTDEDPPGAESANVHAELGPATDETVLVTCHVDAHDIGEGAVDNGAGVATCLEIAKALSRRDASPDRRVGFVAYGAEEVGLIGSRRHAAAAEAETVAVVNVDGVCRARDLEFHTHGFEALARVARAACDALDHPCRVVDSMSPHSDHWPFVARGVPGYHVVSDTGSRDRGWGHTAADTLDKIDVRDIREAAVVLSEVVLRLANADVTPERKTEAEVRDRLRSDGYEEGMRVTGDWSSLAE